MMNTHWACPECGTLFIHADILGALLDGECCFCGHYQLTNQDKVDIAEDLVI